MRRCALGMVIVLLAGCGRPPGGSPATAGIAAVIQLAAIAALPLDFPAGYRLYSADSLPRTMPLADDSWRESIPGGSAAIAIYYENDAPSFHHAGGWIRLIRPAGPASRSVAYADAASFDRGRLWWRASSPAGLGERRFMATTSLHLGSGDYDLAKIVFERCGLVVAIRTSHPISFAHAAGPTAPAPLKHARALDRRLLASPLCAG
ncbi:MAG TPA: hypothetical protein VD886_11155 [Herpetosiphonaceae bacterium]|nr:hypothetical protein [Herpetosiphonaceae bacterium]